MNKKSLLEILLDIRDEFPKAKSTLGTIDALLASFRKICMRGVLVAHGRIMSKDGYSRTFGLK